MNNKHKKTLAEVFKEPTPKNLEFQRIEALLIAVGVKVIEGSGSKVRFAYNDVAINLHRPHPEKEAKPYQVRAIKEFLMLIGCNHEHY